MMFEKDVTTIYAVKFNERTLPDGKTIFTSESCHEGFCFLEYEAGSTGFRNGDAGHGGRTYLRLENQDNSAAMQVRINGREISCKKLEIILGGDDEFVAILDALRFITEALSKCKSVNGAAKH